MELGVEWVQRLFWKMGPLVTHGAEEESDQAPCISHHTHTHTHRAQMPLPCREGSLSWGRPTCTLVLASSPGAAPSTPSSGSRLQRATARHP